VYANPNGFSHNSEESLAPFYRDSTRVEILKKYNDHNQSVYKKIRIHPSVLERLEHKKNGLYDGYDSKWYRNKYFENCFDINESIGTVKYIGCSEIIESDYKSAKE